MPELILDPSTQPPVLSASEVALTIEVGEPLDSLIGTPLGAQVCDAIAHDCDALLKTLGLPGYSSVQMVALTTPMRRDGLLRVRVHGRLCRYPQELLLFAYCYVTGVPLAQVPFDALRNWLRSAVSNQSVASTTNRDLIEWLTLAFIGIIKRRPSSLLITELAQAYLTSLPKTEESPEPMPDDATVLREVLACVLDQRVSLADQTTVARVLRESPATPLVQEDVAEQLVAALRPAVLEVRLPSEYLKQITLDEQEKGIFTMLRDGLFYELGLQFPRFQLVAAEDLKPNSFMFKINHLTTLPRHGLSHGQCMVNDTLDRLNGIVGDATLNPANGNECSLIDEADRERLPANLTVWTPLGYLILALAGELRERGGCFVDMQFARAQLDKLQLAFPALVETCRAQYSMSLLTRLLQGLIAENISIRDLRLILGAALDFGMIETDSRYIVFDERLPSPAAPDATAMNDAANLVAFVRMQMKRYISHLNTRGRSTLVVYLLEPDVEQTIISQALAYREGEVCRASAFTNRFGEGKHEALLEAVRVEVGSIAPLVIPHAVLTTAEARPWVRALLADEFPRMQVLAYQELVPEMNIQPIARITLDEH